MGLYTAHILLLPDLICSCCAFAIITAQFNLLLSAVHLPGTANSLADAHSQYGYKQRPRIHSPEVPPTFLPDLIVLSAVHLPGTANSLADALSHNNPPPPFFCSNYPQANTHPSSSNRPTAWRTAKPNWIVQHYII